MRSSGGLGERANTIACQLSKPKPRDSSINVLQGRLKRLGEGFTKLLCGLIGTKKWTLKSRFESSVVIAKAGIEVEIKFGRQEHCCQNSPS